MNKHIIVLIIVMIMSICVQAEDANLPNLSLWGYQGWHPVNDYNNLNVIDDYNSINPYHAATVSLPDFVSARYIHTQYLRAEAIVSIDGASIGEVYMSGAGRFEIHKGSVDYLKAKDYSKIYFYGGVVTSAEIIEGSVLTIYGYDFSLSDMILSGRWNHGEEFSISFPEVPVNIILYYMKDDVTGDLNHDGVVNFHDYSILAKDMNMDTFYVLTQNWLKK